MAVFFNKGQPCLLIPYFLPLQKQTFILTSSDVKFTEIFI